MRTFLIAGSLMSSAAVSTHSGAGPLGLMSCVRESSPPQDLGNEYDMDKNGKSLVNLKPVFFLQVHRSAWKRLSGIQ